MPPGKIQLHRDSAVPIYEQVSEFLKARIAAGEYAPGERLPGIKALAKTLGVNHLTLRQALRRLEEKRIVATESARGTFVLTANYTQLKVALILPNLYESSSRLSAGVQRQMAETQSTVDIFHYDESTKLECEFFHRLVEENYDGAVIFPSLEQESLKPLLKLVLEGFPLVFLDRAPAQTPCWRVSVDNFQGGYQVTEHLIRKGCRRIACEASELTGVADRFEGFLRAMGDHKLPVDYDLVRKFARNDDRIEEVVASWMKLPEPPDGIIFANDFQALRGLRSLTAMNLKVPKDVRIVGFDDLPLASLSYPALTTIRQDFTAVGRAAADLLREQTRLPREKRFCDRLKTVPVELMVRDST